MLEMVKKWADRNLQGDPVIWIIVFLLSLMSILVVYSATGTLAYRRMESTEWYLLKHTMLIFIGLSAMWVAHKIDYRYYSKLSRLALWISVPLLIYTWKSGENINEASRWITIPGVGMLFQPSDLAKLALITSLASMLSKRQQTIADFKESLIPILIWCGVICGLIALADISTACLVAATCMLIMFIGRVPVKYLVMLVVVIGLAGAIAMSVGQRGATAINRIENFLDPDEIPFQAKQAYIAIATGGVAGKGPGNSEQRNFLPHPYSDFIYAIILEEYGLIGGAMILFLYLALLYRGMVTVAKSERPYAGLLSAGLSFALVVQAIVNMGVTVGLGPITGLPLPFISMGGTSLLFTGVALGIIQSVNRGEVDDTWNFNSGEIKNMPRAA